MFTNAIILAALAFAQPEAAPAESSATITALEQAQGFKLLSGPNYKSLWREYKKTTFPAAGWEVSGGVFKHVDGGGGGDIITTDQYQDFEFELQFKTGTAANSGIIYHIAESKDYCWMTGPEFQVLEDAGAHEKPDGLHSCAALYDILAAPATKQLKPANQWNDAKITFRNGVVQHWLNGQKVVEARFFDDAGKPTEDWLKKIAASKFKEWPGFGLETKGHLALQEHPGEVSYRNIKARDLLATAPGELKLFNGIDLKGWTPVVPDLANTTPGPANVWSVKDGLLVCKGEPAGYLRTNDKYTNFILRLEWRFNPETKKTGNGGVLLRMIGEDKVWPKSIEAQLMSGNAGDFFNIGEFTMTGDKARTKGRHTLRTHTAERAIGEWNAYEIIVNHGDIVLNVNGEELNHAANVEEVAGHIGLQSEGVEMQFRNIRLVPLK